ncbi:MAG TPA: YciI family protein [Streptosporangiaceae bacterium]
MKYMLMICTDESEVLSPAEVSALPEIQAWAAEVDRRDLRRGGARLRPSSDATTVRVRDGETLVSDGPFAETKEQMGGFDILECASLDEAIEIAARHPAADGGSVEVRPLWED